MTSPSQGSLLLRTTAYDDLKLYAPIDCATLAYSPPAPTRVIDDLANLAEHRIAELCLKTRETIISKSLGQNLTNIEWENFFSEPSFLSNKSCLFSSYVNHCFSDPSRIRFHQTNEVFVDDDTFPSHVFVTVKVEKTTFIVDLAFRQFIDKKILLSNADEAVIDHLLKYGFVECIEKNLDVYRRLLQAANLHQNKQGCWRLSTDELKPISLKKFFF